MKYKHKNCGQGQLGITNDDGDVVLVRPGEEIVLSRKVLTNGMRIVEEPKVEKESKKSKNKGDMEMII